LEESEKELLSKYQEESDYEAHDKNVVEALKKRKLLNIVTQTSYTVTKGKNFALVR